MVVWLVGLGVVWLTLLCWVPGAGVQQWLRRGPGKRLREGSSLLDLLRPPRAVAPDPFATIHVQQRLAVLSEQIRVLEDDRQVYAKASRLIAHRGAYDDLLDEAFELAGLPVPPQGRGEARRLDAELELAGRGWSW